MLISNATNSLLLLCGHVYLHFWRSKCRRLDKMQIGVSENNILKIRTLVTFFLYFKTAQKTLTCDIGKSIVTQQVSGRDKEKASQSCNCS
ncbi:hypothetical protein Hanom_Chr01g00094591 [Helianthus anomalus]